MVQGQDHITLEEDAHAAIRDRASQRRSACLVGTHALPARADDVNFTVVNVEYEGRKIWVPSTLVVKKGTKVKLKLINNVAVRPEPARLRHPGVQHRRGRHTRRAEAVEFTADKEGVFPIICQLHPAHVGGQLVVLP